MEKHPVDLNAIATSFRRLTYTAYKATLVGNPADVTRKFKERAVAPQVGDFVAEVTTISRSDRAADLNAFGILEEIAKEKVDFGDEDFVWNEDEEGEPHPLEIVYYIRTLDGRRFRWVNATFIAAPLELEY
ncbi:hypothetical protein IPU75_01050 [Ochrobactrum sp. SD129]|nr:hypothetical protein [Ochrobactrum sp. SD129]